MLQPKGGIYHKALGLREAKGKKTLFLWDQSWRDVWRIICVSIHFILLPLKSGPEVKYCCLMAPRPLSYHFRNLQAPLCCLITLNFSRREADWFSLGQVFCQTRQEHPGQTTLLDAYGLWMKVQFP